MASYKQISRGNWKVQVSLGYVNGKKQIKKKQGFKTKKQAEAWANEILMNKNKGFILTNNNELFENFILRWFNDFKMKTLGVTTIASQLGRINTHIIPALGSYKLNEITPSIIQDFYNSLLNKGMKPSSAKKVLDILISCFKYAKKQKLIVELPTDIEKVKEEKSKVECWSKKEVDYFLNKFKDHYLYTPVLMAVLTGVRIGEECGLRWCDVNFKEKYINVVGQVIYDRIDKKLMYTPILKTDSSYRHVSIPDILISHLEAIKGNSKDNDFVILSREGNMCNPRNLSMNFTKNIAKFKDEKGSGDYMQLKQISWHGLRHTHATLLLLNGENIKVISERLGHKNISITLETYSHVLKEMKHNTANLLDSMFSNL